MPDLVLHDLQHCGFKDTICVNLIGLPAVQISFLQNLYEYYEKKNQTMTTTDCWAAEILYSARIDIDPSPISNI